LIPRWNLKGENPKSDALLMQYPQWGANTVKNHREKRQNAEMVARRVAQ
jgi:hypothetical protein